MHKLTAKYRYALCCILSSLASILGFVNPLLAGVVVSRALRVFSIPLIAPLILGMAAVKGARILLRIVSASVIRGSRRSPVVWLQNRVGKWLWWIEPIVHSWGAAGLAVREFLGVRRGIRLSLGKPRKPKPKTGLAMRAASFIVYYVTDTLVTVLSGLLYYLTHSYALSLLAVLLPAAEAAPWLAEKSVRFRRLRRTTGRYRRSSAA